jgi:hypothetical protein
MNLVHQRRRNQREKRVKKSLFTPFFFFSLSDQPPAISSSPPNISLPFFLSPTPASYTNSRASPSIATPSTVSDCTFKKSSAASFPFTILTSIS